MTVARRGARRRAACIVRTTFAGCEVPDDGQRFVMFPSTEVESTKRGVVTFVTRSFNDLAKIFEGSR